MRKYVYYSIFLSFMVSFLFLNADLSFSGEIKTLTLGHINAFSGGAARYGQDGKQTMILAIEEINARGGITVAGQQYKLEAIHLDGKYRADQSLAAYRRLVDFHKVKFMAIMGTGPARAVMPCNEKDGVLLDVGSPAPAVTTSCNRLVLCPNVRGNGTHPPIAKEAIKKGWKTMGMIADHGDWGKDHVEGMTKFYENEGGKVVGIERINMQTATDFYPQVTKLKGLNPDCIYIVAHEEPGGRITRQLREVGYKGNLVFTEQLKRKGMEIAGMKNIEGAIFIGSQATMICTAPEGTPEMVLKFRDRYFKRWPKNKTITAYGPWPYNFVYYVTRAMEIAGTVKDARKVRAACNQAVAEKEYLLGARGWTKGGRGFGTYSYAMEIKDGKVRITSRGRYPKELAEQGEKCSE